MTTPRAIVHTQDAVSPGALYVIAGGVLLSGVVHACALLALLGWRAETRQRRAELLQDHDAARGMLDDIDEWLKSNPR